MKIFSSDRDGLSVRVTPKERLYPNLAIAGTTKGIGLILALIRECDYRGCGFNESGDCSGSHPLTNGIRSNPLLVQCRL
ncbi:hypothetical protein XNC1_2454 [Xenorhabdus nematophila ATCC 19061]|uniref:Uncharacterized protein n=1 Tax=Xenorhabdus nematophila (strain ATCC 19061 / DSM 3370 / CCUG 14189 / LMG 1036 / NCIMB 9965 / AN6) TaxID=406817 RepID=D3VGS7_XENNA|nr:hypothetical protein XNC1_2454 [Xenorhabdus nematophila ATCC 19061]